MKNIKIVIVCLAFLSIMSCKKSYTAPEKLVNATWITNIPPNTDYAKNVGEFISFMDLSHGALSHQWTISSGNKFLKVGFNPKDSLLLQVKPGSDTTSTDNTINVLFLKSGLNKVTIRNTFPDSVTYPGTIPIASHKENGVWVIEKTWEVNIYGPILPAFKVLDSKGAEVVNVAKDDLVSLADSAKWPIVEVEAGDTLYFIDLTTDGRPDGRIWSIKGGKPLTSNDSIAKIAFLKLGEYQAGSINSTRTLPVNKANKLIPLKIKVIPSTKPFEFIGGLSEAEDQTISFSVNGEVAPFSGKEGDFTVHVINTSAGFDQNIPVQSASVSSTNATKIELVLAQPIYNTDSITVSYSGTGIESVDTRTLSNFGPKTVTPYLGSNILPANSAGFEDASTNYKGAFAAGYWVGNKNGTATDPLFARTTDKFASGTASMRFNASTSLPNTITLQGSYFASLNLPAGTYKLSVKVFLDGANTMSKFLTLVQQPFTIISWDISNTPRGQWVTLSQDVTFGADLTKRYDITINAADNPNATGPQKMYFDDLSLTKLEKRP